MKALLPEAPADLSNAFVLLGGPVRTRLELHPEQASWTNPGNFMDTPHGRGKRFGPGSRPRSGSFTRKLLGSCFSPVLYRRWLPQSAQNLGAPAKSGNGPTAVLKPSHLTSGTTALGGRREQPSSFWRRLCQRWDFRRLCISDAGSRADTAGNWQQIEEIFHRAWSRSLRSEKPSCAMPAATPATSVGMLHRPRTWRGRRLCRPMG